MYTDYYALCNRLAVSMWTVGFIVCKW